MAEQLTYACIILGGGGHARVLIDTLQLMRNVRLYGVLDPNPRLWGTTLLDVPILGGDDLLASLAGQGVNRFVIGLGGAGDNHPRQRLFDLAREHGLTPMTVIHPTASISRWAKVADGSQLLPGSIVNAGAELGFGVIVNSGSVVEHDCQIGDHVHVATGAVLTSTVRVGPRAHIGAGATIRQGVVIGEDAIVGAGAVVVKDVQANQVVVGVPAHAIEKRPR